jgi:hypothetical protein
MKIFIKPSGAEVPVNENSEAAAIALGWKEKGATESEVTEVTDDAAPKRRGRPPKG